MIEKWISKAVAEALYTTQPTLSITIKKLKQEYDLLLFSRKEYRLKLSEEGKVFFRWAKQCLRTFRELDTVGRELDLLKGLYGSETPMKHDEVKARIAGDLEKLNASYTTGPVEVTTIERFINHSAFGVEVGVPDIIEGFYRKFDATQGKRGTFYSGAALDTNGTSSVWVQAEGLLTQAFSSERFKKNEENQ